jgi:hypothetical protein
LSSKSDLTSYLRKEHPEWLSQMLPMSSLSAAQFLSDQLGLGDVPVIENMQTGCSRLLRECREYDESLKH